MTNARWSSGARCEGPVALAELWKVCGEHSTLVVLGAGFDPRTAVAYEHIAAAAPTPPDVVLLDLDGLDTDAETAELGRLNRERLKAAADAAGATLTALPATGHGAVSTGMVVARDFFATGLIERYDQIVVDVSALPRSVFFPLLKGLLQIHDGDGGWSGDLHVVACENHRVDALIVADGTEAPGALAGFADHNPRPVSGVTRIWVPILGEGEWARLDVLWDDIRPEEVCPVLPFPAANPRRCDDLVREYRSLLFDNFRVEPRNVIYASESNPYDLYRTLSALDARYREALSSLGDTRMILSAHSSKLLSIGVLLTAYERNLEVRHVSPARYSCNDMAALVQQTEHDLVVDLWLTGEPYAAL